MSRKYNKLIRNSTAEFLIFTAQSGEQSIEARYEDETVWLTQEQMAVLFNKGRTTITEHICNIFKENELNEKEVCRLFQYTTKHGAIEGKLKVNSFAEKSPEILKPILES